MVYEQFSVDAKQFVKVIRVTLCDALHGSNAMIPQPVSCNYNAAMTVLFVLFGMNYIIDMTANDFAEDIQASLNAGMNAHLAKPLDMDEVLKTIARFVR